MNKRLTKKNETQYWPSLWARWNRAYVSVACNNSQRPIFCPLWHSCQLTYAWNVFKNSICRNLCADRCQMSIGFEHYTCLDQLKVGMELFFLIGRRIVYPEQQKTVPENQQCSKVVDPFECSSDLSYNAKYALV